jgi:hypothetical protein
MRKVFPIVIAILIFFGSCKHSPKLDNAPIVSFKNDIQPIFSGNCMQSGCHGGTTGGEDGEAFPLDSYSSVFEHVKPGNADNSSIYKAITGRGGSRLMPPNAPLPDNEIQEIYLWIEEGAQNN